MKKIKVLMTFLCMMVMVFGMVPSASGYDITPSYSPIWTGTATSQSQIDIDIAAYLGSATELYKSDYESAGPGIDSGSLAGSYDTLFDPITEPTGATITWNDEGMPYISPIAYLLVKDGKQGNPAWYLFELSNPEWDGKETLYLSGFWFGEGVQGSISHVTLYGTSTQVPEPTTLLLLGLGLVGLAGIRRGLKK